MDREKLGQHVRHVWVAWAREQPNPKPSWLVPWGELSEPDREVDRRIGEALARIGAESANRQCADRMQEQHDATVAYVRDRAEQYANDSGCKVALENLAAQLQAGEHMSAFAHGELDDLIAEPMRGPKWSPRAETGLTEEE